MTDKLLIAGFLEENFDLFQAHLDSKDIEPSEAEVIIDRLKEDD
jgi:hypothetical protein